MSLSPQQPLFPHHTGGPAPQLLQQPTSYQQMAPSAPTTPGGFASLGFSNNMTYQPLQAQSTGYNPFFSNPVNTVQQQPSSNQPVNTTQASTSYNPFTRSPTRIASPSLGQIPEQTQTSFQASAVYQSPAPMSPPETAANPFFAHMAQPAGQMGQQIFGQQQATQQVQNQPQAAYNPFAQQQPAQQFYGQQPQMLQQQQFYQPQRPDKASIMALFNNYPQTTPQQPGAESMQSSYQATQTMQSSHPPTIPENQTMQTPMASVQQNRSVPQPTSPSTNPFMSNANSASAIVNTNATTTSDPFAARSRESMNLGLDLAWTNGRHSPDAFASLSARHG
ncbi:hypothetical protein F66182_10455 [Fusarium sp. NRRL 66182]|nr:hypothetical protein F66182_10455 [Fusarium sp. NRRL 66182]